MEETCYIPSTWARFYARTIDQLISVVLYLPFAKTFLLLFLTEEDVFFSLGQLIVFFLIPAVYEGVFLAVMQRTPGKWLFGLTVVPAWDSSAPLRWDQCLLRPLVGKLSFFFSLAPFALAFFRYDRTHLADWVANTRVVQSSPRAHRPRIRWVVGLFFILFSSYEGMVSSSRLLSLIDWDNGRVNARQLINVPSSR